MNPTQFIYNGLTIDENSGYLITESDGIDTVPIRTSSANKTNAHGGNIYAQKYGMRRISLIGTIQGSDVDDFFTKKRALVSAYSITDSDDLEVTMWNSVSRTIKAKVVTAPQIPALQGNVTRAPFLVELLCSNPFWLGDLQSYTIGLTQPGGGTLPATFPWSWDSGDTPVMQFVNNGDASSYAKFTITGPVQNPTVINNTTGKNFTIMDTLASGEYIEIYRTQAGLFVIKNGSENVRSSLVGSLFEIEQGVNNISYTATNYEASSTLQGEFNSPYLTF